MLPTDLPDRLADAGLPVETVDGWQDHGRPYAFRPRGVVDHHTAGHQRSETASLQVVTEGRKGLPGPLCQVYVSREPVVYVVARGFANHAGSGGWRHLRGNGSVAGVEVEHVGTAAEGWPSSRIAMVDVTLAVLLQTIGRDADWLCGHKEWTDRKPDPWGIGMSARRVRVAKLLATRVHLDDAHLPERVLGDGDRGPDVEAWQRNLGRLGHEVAVDGIFGPNTERATRRVQRMLGVTSDGLVGPMTRAAAADYLDRADPSVPILEAAMPVLFAPRRTPDYDIAAFAAEETGHTVTADADYARRAAAAGQHVVAVGHPAADALGDEHDAEVIAGADALETAIKTLRAAREDWPR